jgi:hypothetical protein
MCKNNLLYIFTFSILKIRCGNSFWLVIIAPSIWLLQLNLKSVLSFLNKNLLI